MAQGLELKVQKHVVLQRLQSYRKIASQTFSVRGPVSEGCRGTEGCTPNRRGGNKGTPRKLA